MEVCNAVWVKQARSSVFDGSKKQALRGKRFSQDQENHLEIENKSSTECWKGTSNILYLFIDLKGGKKRGKGRAAKP
jgi:hypothetical protein